MIKIKAFDYKDYEKLNKFVEEHPPINTKDGSGIILRDNFIIVLYEDGKFNDKAQFESAVNFAINTARGDLINKKIAGQAAQVELDKMLQPADYEGKSPSELISFFQKKGLSYKQSEEMMKLVQELHQKKWLAEKEMYRQESIVIPSLEALLGK